MSEITNTGMSKETAAAPLEQVLSGDTPETDICNLDLSALTTKDGSILDYIGHRLEGCPNVQLLSWSFKAQAGAAGDFLRIGMASINSSASIKSLAGKKNGFKHKANDRNYGEEIERDLIPMSNVSRQIQPDSSQIPMLRLCYEKSAGMDLTFTFRYKVNGVREFNDVFSAADVVSGAGIAEAEASSAD